MAAADLISLGIGSPAGIRAFVLVGLSLDGSAPPPTPSSAIAGPGGGGTGIDYQVPRRKRGEHVDKRIERLVDETQAKLAYEKLLESHPHKSVKEKAAAVVRKYAKSEAATPAVETVNWQKLQADAAAVAKIIAIWAAERKRIDDEELRFMLED